MPSTEIISEILSRNQFDELSIRLAGLEADQQSLIIGVLGEFSTGKSTLINAMLGKSVLPAMEKPTTARITEIVPEAGLDELGFYLKNEQGALKPVSVLDFDDALLTPGREVAVIKVPSNDLVPNGYCIVDTPGLASLDETHADITFGYLPILDGAIICQDINKGGLTESLRAFLSKKEVRPFLSRIVFALTRADTKQPENAEDIRLGFVSELTALADDLKTPINNLDARVLTLSPLQMLQHGKGRDTLAGVFLSVFVAARVAMMADRVERERKDIISLAIALLHNMRDNLSLDRSQYAARKIELQDEIARIEADQRGIIAAVDQLKPQISRLVARQTDQIRPALMSATQQDLTAVIAKYQSDIEQEINMLLKNKFSNASDLVVDASTSLVANLEKLASIVEMGKFVATAAIVATVCPEAELAANIAGSMLTDSTVAVATGEVVEGAIGANMIRMAKGSRLGDFIRAVNPAEHIGNFLHHHFREKSINKEIDRMAALISVSIIDQMKEVAERDLILPALMASRASKKQIEALLDEEKNDQLEIQRQRSAVQKDILLLAQ